MLNRRVHDVPLLGSGAWPSHLPRPGWWRSLTSLTLVWPLLLTFSIAQGADNGLSRQHVVVVLDDSGSMFETMGRGRGISKMEAAKSALTTVLNGLPPEAHVGIVVLNQGTGPDSWIVPLGPIHREQTRAAIASLQPDGGTPLGYFMKVAADALLAERKKTHYGSYRLLIVTDGEATDGDAVKTHLPEIIARGITVDVIGVDMPQAHSLATNVHSYRRADDPRQLRTALSEVFAESSDQPGDAGESDFQMLAGFPDEVASAALRKLSHPNSAALGTTDEADEEEPEPATAVAESGPSEETTEAAPTEQEPLASELDPAPSEPLIPHAVKSTIANIVIALACVFCTFVAIVAGVILVLKRMLS